MKDQDRLNLFNSLMALTTEEDVIRNANQGLKSILLDNKLYPLKQAYEMLRWPEDKDLFRARVCDEQKFAVLKLEDSLFQSLREIVAALRTIADTLDARETTSIEAIISVYESFIAQFCESRGTQRTQLLTPLLSMLVPGHGWYYVNTAFASSIIENDIFKDKPPEEKQGTSKITYCGGIHFKFSTAKPLKPGREQSVHYLDAQLFPIAVSNPSVLIRLEGQLPNKPPLSQREQVVLATQTVEGKTFDHFVKDSNALASIQIPSKNYSHQFVLQCLVNPGDGKFDNFMRLSTGELIAIDNEIVYEPEIVKLENKKHTTCISSCIFLLPQMSEALDAEIRQQILLWNVPELILKWLAAIEQENQRYQEWLVQGLFEPSDLAKMSLPLHLISNTVSGIYRKMIRLQMLLRKEQDIPHRTLLFELMPEVALFYSVVEGTYFEESPGKKMNVLQLGRRLGSGAHTFESFNLLIDSNTKTLDEYAIAAAQHKPGSSGQIGLAQQPIKEAKAELLQHLDWTAMTEEEVKHFLNDIMLMHCKELVDWKFYNVSIPMDSTLQVLINSSSIRIETLTLERCRLADFKLLERLISSQAQMHLCLGKNDGIEALQWKMLLNNKFLKRFSLSLDSDTSLILKPKTPERLRYLVEIKKVLHKENNTETDRAYLESLEQFLLRETDILSFAMQCLMQNKTPYQELREQEYFATTIFAYRFEELQRKNTEPLIYLNLYQQLPNTFLQQCFLKALETIKEDILRECLKREIAFYPHLNGKRESVVAARTNWLQSLSSLTQTSSTQLFAIRVQSGPQESFYLKDEIVQSLLENAWLLDGQDHPEDKGNFNFTKKQDLVQNGTLEEGVRHGNHLVIPLDFQGVKVHLKIHPDFPGMEMAFSLLAQRIMGRYFPFVTLWEVTSGSFQYPVLVSQTMEGTVLNDELLKLPVDPVNYSSLLLMMLLTNPGDNNPANILAKRTQRDGQEFLELVTIDNDRLFAKPFEAGKLRVTSILYCMKEMLSPIDPSIRDMFLSLDPSSVLNAWIDNLEHGSRAYSAMFGERLKDHVPTAKEGDPTRFYSVLLPFLIPGTVETLWLKFDKLQMAMRENPKITHLELLALTQPSLAAHYEPLLRDDSLNPLTRFEKAVGNEYRKEVRKGVTRYSSTMDMREFLKMQGRLPETDSRSLIREANSDFEIAREELRDIKETMSVFSDTKRRFIQGDLLEFSKLRPYLQSAILKSIAFDRDIQRNGESDKELHRKILNGLIELAPKLKLQQLFLQQLSILTDEDLVLLCKKLGVNLKTLERIKITGASIATVPSALINAPKIERLELEDLSELKAFTLNQGPVTSISLKNNKALTEITINAKHLQQLSLQACVALSDFKMNAPELKEVDLSQCPELNDEQLKQLIEQCPEINYLNLTGCSDSKILNRILKESLPAITAMQIPENEHEAYLSMLASVIDNQETELDLKQQSHLTGFTFRALCQALSENTSVESIDLRFCYLGDAAIVLLAQVLEKHPRITSINLTANNLSNIAALAIAELLSKNHRIESVELAVNSFDDTAALALVRLIPKHGALKELGLNYTNIGKNLWLEYLKVLETNNSIKELWLSSLSKRCLKPLVLMLEKNKTLEKIGISWKWGNTELLALESVLSEHKSITKLEFSGGSFNEACINTLLRILEANSKLSLKFGGVFVSKKAVTFLENHPRITHQYVNGIGAYTLNYFVVPLSNQLNSKTLGRIRTRMTRDSLSHDAYELNNNVPVHYAFFAHQRDTDELTLRNASTAERLHYSLQQWTRYLERMDVEVHRLLQQRSQEFGFTMQVVNSESNGFFENVLQQLIATQETPLSLEMLIDQTTEVLLTKLLSYQTALNIPNINQLLIQFSKPYEWVNHTIYGAIADKYEVTLVVIDIVNRNPIIIKPETPRAVIYLSRDTSGKYHSLVRDPQITATEDISLYIEHAKNDLVFK